MPKIRYSILKFLKSLPALFCKLCPELCGKIRLVSIPLEAKSWEMEK